MPDYPPLFFLEQVIWQLDQDWQVDYADAYEAVEAWFAANGTHPEVLRMLTADVDQLFADKPDTAARLAHFSHINWPLDSFDDFLRAIQKRAEGGLAGNPEPMRRMGQGS